MSRAFWIEDSGWSTGHEAVTLATALVQPSPRGRADSRGCGQSWSPRAPPAPSPPCRFLSCPDAFGITAPAAAGSSASSSAAPWLQTFLQCLKCWRLWINYQLKFNQLCSLFPVEWIKKLSAAHINCSLNLRLINVPFELWHNRGDD